MPPPAALSLRDVRSLSVQHNVTRILDYLYLGGNDICDDCYALQELQITGIINCTRETECYFADQLQYLHFPLEDSGQEDVRRHFPEAFAFIDAMREAGGRVLVHCNVGMSRSATVVIAYLMRTENMSLLEAFRYTRERRPVTSPNQGFMAQLCELDEELFGRRSLDITQYKDNRFIDIDQLAARRK